MKIVCDSCGAKYSIADEKVAGKVFKIRCKKCSAVIVVRGDQVAAEEEQATNVYDYGGDAVWHVVVDGDQQGPFAPAQIGEMLSAGTIDWEAYVWREGFDGWLAARDVPELVEAVTGQAQQPAQQAAEPAPSAAAAAGYGGAMGADPFGGQAQDQGYGAQDQGYGAQDQGYGGGGYDQGYAQEASGGGGGMFGGGYGESHEVASRATHDAGADLFAQSDASQSPFGGGDVGGDDDVVASQPSPRVSSEQASMTGARNENSVLFSLSNLQALATGSGGGSAAPAPVAAAPRPGHASGEGSGLIDIRALASATASPSGGAREERANADDLLSIGTGGLGGSLGAPVLAPVQEEKSNKGLLIGAVAAAGVLAAALVVVVVVLVTKEPEPVAQASGAPNAAGAGTLGAPTAGGGTPTPTTEAQPSEEQQAAEGSEEEEASAGSEEEAEEAEEDDGRTSRSSRRRRAARARSSGGGGGGASAPEREEEPESSGGGGGGGGSRDIDSLLDRALGGGGGSRATQMRESSGGGGGGADLPETPPRDAVASALRSVSGAVSACGGGQHGVANTTVTVSGSTGRVTNAQVTGQFAGTPVGSCVARAVRRARFPRFRRSTFRVSFPYRL